MDDTTPNPPEGWEWRGTPECGDNMERCSAWAYTGECEKNPGVSGQAGEWGLDCCGLCVYGGGGGVYKGVFVCRIWGVTYDRP